MAFVVWFFLGLLWLLPIETLAQGVKSDAGRDEPYDVNEEDGPKRVSPPLHGFADHAKKHGVPGGLADIVKRALADSSVEGFASEQPRSEALAKNLAALNGKKEDSTFDLSASISDMESQKVDIMMASEELLKLKKEIEKTEGIETTEEMESWRTFFLEEVIVSLQEITQNAMANMDDIVSIMKSIEEDSSKARTTLGDEDVEGGGQEEESSIINTAANDTHFPGRRHTTRKRRFSKKDMESRRRDSSRRTSRGNASRLADYELLQSQYLNRETLRNVFSTHRRRHLLANRRRRLSDSDCYDDISKKDQCELLVGCVLKMSIYDFVVYFYADDIDPEGGSMDNFVVTFNEGEGEDKIGMKTLREDARTAALELQNVLHQFDSNDDVSDMCDTLLKKFHRNIEFRKANQ